MDLRKESAATTDVAEVLECVAGFIGTERYFGGVSTRPSFSSSQTGLAGDIAEECLYEIAWELSAWFNAEISNGRLVLSPRSGNACVAANELTRMAAHRVAARLLSTADAQAAANHSLCAEKTRHSILCRLHRQEYDATL